MEISLLIKVLESFVHKEGAFKATLKMISWRFYLVFIVVFYSKSVLSCYSDSDCYGSKTCCDGSCCSKSSSGTNAAVIVLIIFVVGFKLVFWIALCYCRRRRHPGTPGVVLRRPNTAPRTAVVVNNSSHVVEQGHTPPQQSYNPPQPSYNPPQQTYNEQGSTLPGYAYPQNTTPIQDDVLVNPANNPPPPYTDSPPPYTDSPVA